MSLTRLLEHRGTDVASLAAASGIAESELRAVLGGAPPSEAQLRDLAPALGFHAADLFVIADVPLPEDLLPLDAAAGAVADDIVRVAMVLPREQRRRLHRLVRGLPQDPRPDDDRARAWQIYDQSAGGGGAMLVTLLSLNRNLRSPLNTARTVAFVTRGDMYLSAPTYQAIGTSPAGPRPEWVAGIATTLGIPAGDLGAVLGVTLPHGRCPADSSAAEMAELIWDLRRLSRTQTELVRDEAEAMLVPLPADAGHRDWHRVRNTADGIWWGAQRDRD